MTTRSDAHEEIRHRRLSAKAAIAARLRHARGDRTVAELAEAAGMPRTTIYRYEAAAMLPGVDVVPDLARAYGCRLKWLVTGEGPRLPAEAAE